MLRAPLFFDCKGNQVRFMSRSATQKRSGFGIHKCITSWDVEKLISSLKYRKKSSKELYGIIHYLPPEYYVIDNDMLNFEKSTEYVAKDSWMQYVEEKKIDPKYLFNSETFYFI